MRSRLKACRSGKDLVARHQRALKFCRKDLQKALSPEFFKTHFFFFTTSLECDVSVFLDRMQDSDEQTFQLFMHMLRSYDRSVYHKLKQTLISIENVDEEYNEDNFFLENHFDDWESMTMPAYIIKEVLKKGLRMKSVDSIKKNPMLYFYSNEDSESLPCFIIDLRSENYKRPWIKHFSTRKTFQKQKEKHSEPYLATTCKDMIFRLTPEIPFHIKKPMNSTKAYVCENQMYSSKKSNLLKSVTQEKKLFEKDPECSQNKKHADLYIQTNSKSPPPLPPKPDSLSPLPTVSNLEKSSEFANEQIVSNLKNETSPKLFDKQKLEHKMSISSLPPPIPSRQKSTCMTKPPPATPPHFNISLSRESSAKISKNQQPLFNSSIFKPFQKNFLDTDFEDVSDDNISLSYNVEPEYSDYLNEPYEPINPIHHSTNLFSGLSKNNILEKELISDINNQPSKKLNNYCNPNSKNNDVDTQINLTNNPETLKKKNEYLLLEANEHDLHACNKPDDIKDKNNCSTKFSNKCQTNSKKIIEDNSKFTEKNKVVESFIDLNRVFKDCAKVVDSFESLEINREKTSSVCLDRSSSIKSEPLRQQVVESATQINETEKMSSVRKKDELFEELLANQLNNSSKNSAQAVGRSSSGISVTVSERMATRDSGVDSAVSQNLHEPYLYSTKQFSENNVNNIVTDSNVENFLNNFIDDNCNKHFDASYYEDIDHLHAANSDSFSQSHYLDPRIEFSKNSFTFFSEDSNQKYVSSGSLFITDGILVATEESCKDIESDMKDGVDFEKNLIFFINTVIGYDKDGNPYYLPSINLKKYGDPSDEPWYYPFPLKLNEASVFLKKEAQKGCFIVYKVQEETYMPEGCAYFLSVYSDVKEVLHYPIVENVRGDLMIENDDKSFLSICELVQFYRRNRHGLKTKLERCLKDSKLPITARFSYPSNMELPRKSINLSRKILCEGKFGPLCYGTLFSQQKVLVRLFQKEVTTEKEDSFLNEALVLTELTHKNIIKLVGICCLNRPYYIVMESFGNGTLKDLLKLGFLHLDRKEIYYDICLQMTAAMVYLEKKHFVLHRDISSSTFLISYDYCVKLFRFEKACIVDDDNYKGNYDEDILIRWAAPEVLAECHYSTKSDIWSLAVVFWELFSHGLEPYQCFTEQQVILSVLEKYKLEKPLNCNNKMYSLMARCWSFEASLRPSFLILQKLLKAQSKVCCTSKNKGNSETLTSLNSFDSVKPSFFLSKKDKQLPQTNPNNSAILESAFQFRNSNIYTDAGIKEVDAIKISQNFLGNKKSSISRVSPAFIDSSSSVHLSNENISKNVKERKSIRRFFKSRKND